MTIHVNIGKAKSTLSKLIAASLRGEEVVINHDGVPQVRLMPVAKPSHVNPKFGSLSFGRSA